MKILDSLLIMTCEMAPYILVGLFIAGLMHAFVPSRLMSRHLSSPDWKSVLKAALIGIPLPLCSCGVLPAAVALRRSGASKAATSSFLISTPQTGVDSIAATWSLLGPAFAIIRPIAALVTALFGGTAVGIFDKDTYLSDSMHANHEDNPDAHQKSFAAKLKAALRYGFYDMVQSIGGWLVFGLIIAALITVLVPADFFSSLADRPLIAMLAVVIIAVPMYVCATGSIPIALALMLKGLSPGTALVLLMAGPAANFASVTILTRTIGRRSASIYLTSIIIGSIAFGLAADYLMPRSWFPLPAITAYAGACHTSAPLFGQICAIILAILLVISFALRIISSRNTNKHNHISTMSKQYKIKGMNCAHCQQSVQNAIAAVNGVDSVTVDLRSGIAEVNGNPTDNDIYNAIEVAGFDPVKPI